MNERDKELQAEELADLARRLEAALEVDAPEARSTKALFVAGAGARTRRSSWTAALVPATAAVAVLIALAVVSQGALPGQALYPFRKALDRVGLAPSTANEVRDLVDRAERLVTAAGTDVYSSPDRAQALALRALGILDEAERLVGDVGGAREDELDAEIDALDDRADDVYEAAEDFLEDREREPLGNDGDDKGDDSSGRGSGDDDGTDDSSGSGSGEDDSSGPGSGGDDSGGDDSSGSGSGSGDDSSGSGSGSGDD